MPKPSSTSPRPLSREHATDSYQALQESLATEGGQVSMSMAVSILLRLVNLRNSGHGSQESLQSAVLARIVPVLQQGDMSTLSASQVRDVIYAGAKLRLSGEQWLHASIQQAGQVVDKFSAYDIATVMWAVAAMNVQRFDAGALIDAFLRQVNAASPQDCSNFAYACHQLGHIRFSTYQVVMRRMTQLPEANPIDLSLIVWVIAQRLHEVPAEIGTLVGFFLVKVPQAKAQSVSQMFIAMQSFAHRDRQRFEDVVVDRSSRTRFNLMQVFDTLAKALAANADAASPQALSNAVWVCAKTDAFDVDDHQAMVPLFRAFQHKLGSAKPQEVSQVVWAAERVRFYDPELIHLCFTRLAQLAPVCCEQVISVCLYAAGSQSLFYSVRHQCVPLVKRFLQLIESRKVKTQAVANVLLGMAALDIRENQAASRRIFDEGMARMPHIKSIDASSLIYSAGQLGVLDAKSALVLLNHVLRFRNDFKTLMAGRVVRGLSHVGVQGLPPAAEVLVDYFMVNLERANIVECVLMVMGLADLVGVQDKRVELVVARYLRFDREYKPRLLKNRLSDGFKYPNYAHIEALDRLDVRVRSKQEAMRFQSF